MFPAPELTEVEITVWFSSRDVKETLGVRILKLRGEVWAKCRHLEVVTEMMPWEGIRSVGKGIGRRKEGR